MAGNDLEVGGISKASHKLDAISVEKINSHEALKLFWLISATTDDNQPQKNFMVISDYGDIYQAGLRITSQMIKNKSFVLF